MIEATPIKSTSPLPSLGGPLYSAALRRALDTDNLRRRKLFRRAALPSDPETQPATRGWRYFGPGITVDGGSIVSIHLPLM